MVTLFVLGFLGDAAHAGQKIQVNASWKDLKGHSACGGVDQNGKLQEPCAFEKAKFEKKALGKCPKGSFFDVGTWSCYSCPSGYNRNARSVTHPMACDKAVTPQTASAKYVGKKKCPSGSILDMRNGGECWTCPSGLGRTAVGIDQWNACGMIGKKAASATFRGRSCPVEGSFADPRNGGECWVCPPGYDRTGNAVTADKACKKVLDFKPANKAAALTCEPGQHFDFIDGGTCWSCPEGSDRTMSSVKSTKACRNKKMKWVTPTREMYGLFGLGDGADEILAEMIAARTEIDDVVKEAATNGKVSQDVALKTAWDVIDTQPWESSYLATLLAKRAIDAARKPVSQRSAAEKDLVDTVSKLFQWNRQFIAYQAKQAHENWTRASRLFYEARSKEMGAANIYSDSMVTPPDYNELIANTIQGTAAVSMAGSVAAGAFLPKFAYMFPYKQVAIKVIQSAGSNPSAFLTTGGGGMSGVAGAAAAPLAITMAIGVIVTMEIDKYAKLEKAEGEIRQAIEIANRPVDLALMLQQKNGKDEFWAHWSTVLSDKTPPSAYFKTRLAAYKSGTADKSSASGTAGTTGGPISFPTINMGSSVDVTAPKPTSGSNWLSVPGEALDIARGDDGTTYIVSTEKLPNGFKVYQRAKTAKAWTLLSSTGATRIAASGHEAWIVNSVGNVYSQMGTGWVPVRAPVAQDIGASAKGVWLVGVDGRIYHRVGKGWQPAAGSALRIDADSNGRPWIVDKQGDVYVHDNNLKWQRVAGASALDVAVDQPGLAHIVGKDGSIYVWDAKSNKWVPLSKGGDHSAIAVGGGQVWSVNATNQISHLK